MPRLDHPPAPRRLIPPGIDPNSGVAGIARAINTIVPMGAADRTADITQLLSEVPAKLTQPDTISALEYAIRKHPSDYGILFWLGVARAAAGDPRASEPLELLAGRTASPDVRILLARIRLQFGDAQQAASDLSVAFGRHAIPSDKESRAFASLVARTTGAPGWCAIDGGGRLILGELAATPVALIDGDSCLAGRSFRPRADIQQFYLPIHWASGSQLSVQVNSRHLIGSPISLTKVTAMEGFVETDRAGLRGWCSLPGDRERVPEIRIAGPRTEITVQANEAIQVTGHFPDFVIQRPFTVPWDKLPNGLLTISGPHGRRLYGSPIEPVRDAQGAERTARSVARKWSAGPRTSHRQGTLIVIPAYRGHDTTLACIESVLQATSQDEEILVITDGSPDLELIARLQTLANQGLIRLDRQEINRGFPATANIGLRCSGGRDVVLLNSDTLVAPGWTARLREVAYSDDGIGTVTPLSNDATIFSYPRRDGGNAIPDLPATLDLNRLAYATNGNAAVDVPTGHGFCLYIKGDCLAQTGVFREDVFAQGYGEENDFCCRAKALGWRHVAAPGVFVTHIGSQSFSRARTQLQQRNLAALCRLYPDYNQIVADWIDQDPLAVFRRRLDIARWREMQGCRSAVALITHDRGGGVLRHVTERARSIEKGGQQAIVIYPGPHRACRVAIPGTDDFPNLIFSIPEELGQASEFFAACTLERVELHHFIGHDAVFIEMIFKMVSEYSIIIHDYSWYCLRSNLTAGEHRYCGEPGLSECGDCVAEHGATIGEAISPVALTDRSARWLTGASSIIAPSADAARRISNRFGCRVRVATWEDDSAPLELVYRRRTMEHRRRICVAGAIGLEKGYNILLRCARLALQMKLPMEFVLVGYTHDDSRLQENGVRITGPYQDSEVVQLIRDQNADLAFMPGQLPETWSYVLSHFWAAGLPVVAFDIGAPAERIKAQNGGIVLPLHTRIDRLAQVLLHTASSHLQVIA
jgi:GT2 family glycosyltransferase/glycosyltransferase involved in cell wall biosynthesis